MSFLSASRKEAIKFLCEHKFCFFFTYQRKKELLKLVGWFSTRPTQVKYERSTRTTNLSLFHLHKKEQWNFFLTKVVFQYKT